MRNLESNYLEKMKNEKIANQLLVMTIQSFNRLNEVAIKNNMRNCISSREFTEKLIEFCQLWIQSDTLDHVSIAVLINELGKIEREQTNVIKGRNNMNKSENQTFFHYLIQNHSDKILQNMHKYNVKQLLLITSGFGSYFIDRHSIRRSSKELQDIMLAISTQIVKLVTEKKETVTFYQLTSIYWSYQYFFLDLKDQFGPFEQFMKMFLQSLIMPNQDHGIPFNMELDLRNSIKLAKTISILDRDQSKYPIFWTQFQKIISSQSAASNRVVSLSEIASLAYVLT